MTWNPDPPKAGQTCTVCLCPDAEGYADLMLTPDDGSPPVTVHAVPCATLTMPAAWKGVGVKLEDSSGQCSPSYRVVA
ncbi:MAG TPA: hypothetical protein VNM34_15030 [Verrucomicrobiae bacterium]|nr:hypothetical protein [Verrucomicrobiae bacterium]